MEVYCGGGAKAFNGEKLNEKQKKQGFYAD